jgi:hypothetical protein
MIISIWERNFGEMIDTDRVGDSNSHLTNSQVSLVKTQYHIHTIAHFGTIICLSILWFHYLWWYPIFCTSGIWGLTILFRPGIWSKKHQETSSIKTSRNIKKHPKHPTKRRMMLYGFVWAFERFNYFCYWEEMFFLLLRGNFDEKKMKKIKMMLYGCVWAFERFNYFCYW